MTLVLALMLTAVPADPPLPPDAAWRGRSGTMETWRVTGTLESLQAYYRGLFGPSMRSTRKSCPAACAWIRVKKSERQLLVQSHLTTTRWDRLVAREVEGGVELTVHWVRSALPKPPEPHAPVALPEPRRSQRDWRADLRP